VTPGARVRRLQDSHAYALVLLFVAVSVAVTLAAPDDAWSRLIVVALQGATLLVALTTSGARRGLRRVAFVLVVAAVVGSAIALVATDGEGTRAGVRAVTLALVVLAPAVLVAGIYRDIRATGGVPLRAVFGVVAIYLLVGMAFGVGHQILADVGSGTYVKGVGDPDAQDFLYFSYITLTTVGYGDIVPVSNVARTVAVLEALTGQLYLVTIVAVIVTNVGRRRPTDAGPRPSEGAGDQSSR